MIVQIEIKDTPDHEKRINMENLVKEFEVLKPNNATNYR
jgi:hypothetical protein